MNNCALSMGRMDRGRDSKVLPSHLPTEQKGPYAHSIDIKTKVHRCKSCFVLFCSYSDVNSTRLLHICQNSNI